ncbi:siderophore ABC transporter substrate-binding protein [Paenibacillus polygoni]|uniref:Siderophore ABC transporter substrate-binding protein n=1 Tax=Paenibacillus polygoni TaxID=3050112 RepID=A0ABY8X164_9BACL|nr:siderophore ABC transporter substrate-binding protein [Paenibacillus polygoni]WIV18738.1 siderophore ABC transporter substrate-binding protein [Paenibacillus polygoni]
MKKFKLSSIFTLVMVMMLTVVLAACGTDSKEAEGGAETNAAAGSNGTAEQAQQSEVTIAHKLGETTLETNPEKVVVFDMGILDSLDKLGIEVTGVPQANIPPYLEKYNDSKYENVGSLKEPDFEKIAEISPDLIIISGRQADSYDELSKIGKTIHLGVDTTRYMDSYKENMQILGQIFNKTDEINTEIAKIEDEIKVLNEKVTASGKNALIILANEGKISAYGAGSRFGIIHDVFGFTPVDNAIEVSTHGQSISFEYIVEKDPDYLFVVDRGAAVSTDDKTSSAKGLVENSLVKNTKAYKEGHIIYLDANYWYLSGGGLASVSEMVKEVSDAFEK